MKKNRDSWSLKILEKAEEMVPIEALQRLVWPGSETDVVPLHMLVTFAHNGGLVVGAFEGSKYAEEQGSESASQDPTNPKLIGFVCGFPGLYITPDGSRPKHCSHMLAVHPDYRDQGVGFALKRAQWQMVRHQGLDLITWTYDPLMSRNAFLNISRLGAVCNTYRRDEYGEMRDGLNEGIPSDRFQVDWWVNSQRVLRRLSKRPRRKLDLAHFLSAGAEIINPTEISGRGFARPTLHTAEGWQFESGKQGEEGIFLVEIPSDFQELKAAEPDLALEWRRHTRVLFENLFSQGYLVLDFVFLPGNQPRSFYVVSHGENTLLLAHRGEHRGVRGD